MSGLILFFKSKLVLAILGAVLFGTAGAVVAAVPFGGPPSSSSSSAPQGQAGLAAVDDATATPDSSATPTKTPTKTPRLTNPPGTGGVTLHGTVQSVNTAANTFTIKQTNGTITPVVVNAHTTYQGAASSLSSLQAGWLVEVTGIYQTNGTFAASGVNADN